MLSTMEEELNERLDRNKEETLIKYLLGNTEPSPILDISKKLWNLEISLLINLDSLVDSLLSSVLMKKSYLQNHSIN